MNIEEELNKLDMKKTALVGLFLLAIYWLIFFDNGRSLEAQTEQARQTITRNQTSQKMVKDALADKGKFENDIKNIILNMKDFQKYFSADVDPNSLQAQVSDFAEQRGLVVNSLKPAARKNEFPGYTETGVGFQVEGSFHNIMSFVSDLTKMDRVIDFSEMKFRATSSGENPQVELQTIMVMYSAKENQDG